jgi:hypothetical protein
MKRNKFNLSNHKLLSADMGKLIPIGLTEALPGDAFQHSTSALVRTSPLVKPVMHPVDVRIHHFFVPMRLIWDDWEDFITGGEDGNDASVFPTINLDTSSGAEGSLADYLGVPTVNSGTLEVSALPFRAYNLCYNEFYRDQDLIDPIDIGTESGTDTTTALDLQNIAWEKDYFTSSRPFTQKGPDITIPLGDKAIVSADVGEGNNLTHFNKSHNQYRTLKADSTQVQPYSFTGPEANSLYADLGTATGIDVNDLRLAFALQRFQEARAQYGSRYTEYLAYMGVNAQDQRLQRPEYIAGGKQTIQFSEVLSTDGSNTGDLKGHGIAALRSNKYQKYIPEHGYIVSFMSVRPKTMYIDALPRTFNRRTKEEFFQKELQLIGQQAIKNKEIKADHADPDETFGWQDRYDEYRKQESTISGEFRSTLNDWHMARDFSTDPALNDTFVECVPTDRIYADTNQNPLQVMVNHHMVARRQLVQTPHNKIM